MQQGLYKVEFRTVHGTGCGVIYAQDGKLLGGNSAFAFIGSYDGGDDAISVVCSTVRHNEDPNFRPLFGIDKITLTLKGKRQGEELQFEGGTTQLPGVVFNSVMTLIGDDTLPPVAAPGPGGIGNGLYSMHITMLDGVSGGNTGVVVLHDGEIHGGDASFNYIGAYSSANGRWKGSLVNSEHTRRQGEQHIFGGYEVGIGFSGTYSETGAEIEATALAGKRSLRFKGTLRRLE
ncbi:GrlR family regulatory protein [Bradyrhizobium prioriisuperbiae]|uniref:GrlR family regulatory protein n=1 Tax=Bradyrhizobium prioriisuperbiae TaxID=2854389 RepID=UPI0028E3C60E|nr:GrlR family regulatory protein [Bradyrhizobium prioritasuperba]